jgi:hypothetical protein
MGETVEHFWGGEAPEEPAAARRRVPLSRWAIGWRTSSSEHYEIDSDGWVDLPGEVADEWDASCWRPVRGW